MRDRITFLLFRCVTVVAMGRAMDDDVSAAFIKGGADALPLAYKRFGPLIYTIALRSLGARQDAEDITQQVFVAGVAEPGLLLDPGPGTLAGWLVTIARNKINDALRERQRDVQALTRIAARAAVTSPAVPTDQEVDRIVLADEAGPAARAAAAGGIPGLPLRPHP